MPHGDPFITRFVQALESLHIQPEIIHLAASTATAMDAAAALGVDVAQIAKSLVFCSGPEPVLVVASGRNRVSKKKVAGLTGGSIRFADPGYVARITGYPVGGVPPVGHLSPLRTFIDEDLLAYPVIYAGAGSPHALVKIAPDLLLALSSGTPADVRDDAGQ